MKLANIIYWTIIGLIGFNVYSESGFWTLVMFTLIWLELLYGYKTKRY